MHSRTDLDVAHTRGTGRRVSFAGYRTSSDVEGIQETAMVIGVKPRTKTTLDDATRDALRVLIGTIGETSAAHSLGLSRETMARALAQLPCHRGTIDAICQSLTTTDSTATL